MILSSKPKGLCITTSFLKSIKKTLKKKYILVSKLTLNLYNKISIINIEIFFSSNTESLEKPFNLFYLFKNQLKIFKSNMILLNIVSLNKYIKKPQYLYLKRQFYKFLYRIFKRKYYLFRDFLKLTSLLVQNKVSAQLYAFMLSIIFVGLQKRQHSSFLFFVKLTFKICLIKIEPINSLITGMKLLIAGRIKGKPRGDENVILIGNTSTQSKRLALSYAKISIYNRYGAFGLKFWINYNKK